MGELQIKQIVFRVSRWISNLMVKVNRVTDIEINPPSSTKFKHNGIGVIIGRGTTLGENVEISSHVCLGEKFSGSGCPTIGDNVKIKTNAVILGSVKVGHDSIIGAGCIVIDDIPPSSLVVGIPGKVVKTL